MMAYLDTRTGCVPNVDYLPTRIVAEAHGSRLYIHPGSTKMYHDLRQIYWWDGMKNDIARYVAKCPNCRQVKAKHLKPGGLTHIIEVPTWEWEATNMDFVVGIPKNKRHHDSIWVIIERLTKSCLFITVKSTYKGEDYARLYIDEIVRWHGIPLSIVSYRGSLCTSHFWRSSRRSWARR